MVKRDHLADDAEFRAMRDVYAALKDLDVAAQNRVLDYVNRRLALGRDQSHRDEDGESQVSRTRSASSPEATSNVQERERHRHDLEGISPIAQKWMKRSGVTSSQLSALFSLGFEEIDLIAKSVPGKNKAERVRSVVLLLGIAGYLGSGVARVADDKLREACGHYKAYDVSNFTKHMKGIAFEASGTRETGYTLTSRGLGAATDLIRQITAAKP
jgi:hypothetical protein